MRWRCRTVAAPLHAQTARRASVEPTTPLCPRRRLPQKPQSRLPPQALVQRLCACQAGQHGGTKAVPLLGSQTQQSQAASSTQHHATSTAPPLPRCPQLWSAVQQCCRVSAGTWNSALLAAGRERESQTHSSECR
eukprot:6186585-Pleurochrysis_carterae.AAC.4